MEIKISGNQGQRNIPPTGSGQTVSFPLDELSPQNISQEEIQLPHCKASASVSTRGTNPGTQTHQTHLETDPPFGFLMCITKEDTFSLLL